MANFMVNRIKALVYFFIGIFRRAMCCFRRRRRLSCDSIPLTNVGIVPNTEKEVETANWHAWEEAPTIVTDGSKNTIQDKIEMYRQQRMAPNPEDIEENVNFFQDMTPRITKQTKVILKDKTENGNWAQGTKLSLAHDPVYGTSELGVWEDSTGWEEQAEEAWEADSILREKKRLSREMRLAEQQRKRLEREMRAGRQVVGGRIS